MAQVKESALVFGRHKNLLGIVSEPENGAVGGPAVVLLNAGIIHRVGPSRIAVEIARGLAEAGYRVLRFDISGIGDSGAAPEVGGLTDVVRADIADAIALASARENGEPSDVVLFGICSGADNAFCCAADHERVRGLVLVDPTVHPTRGFRIRRTLKRLTSTRSWWNILSGHSLRVRWRLMRSPPAVVRPPGYFGLLTLDRPAATRQARALSSRGLRFLVVITRDMHQSCNYPGQIAESLDHAIAPDRLAVEWREEADHLLRREEDRRWLIDMMRRWLEGITPPAEARSL